MHCIKHVNKTIVLIYSFYGLDFIIIKCGLKCRQSPHFHCFYCASTIIRRDCNDWSEASGFTCSKMFIEQRQKQTGNGQQAKTGISEAEQRRKQYQAGVEVTGTGSEFRGQAVQGQTQRWQEE